MIKTDTGYKVILNTGTMSVVDNVKSVGTFFSEMKNEGLWYAMTGQYFGEWVNSMFVSFINWLVDMSDLLIVAGMVVLLLIMFGSKRSRKWMYWVVCAYIMFQILGLMV